MGVSRTRALDYAERLMARPRSNLTLVIHRNRGGITLLHEGRAVTRCYASRLGREQARQVALALGVPLPPEGGTVAVTVPNGVLYRAVAISALDLRIPQARLLLERLQEEAAMARSLGEPIEA